jgi:uncharacterized protein (TIGR00369 family)
MIDDALRPLAQVMEEAIPFNAWLGLRVLHLTTGHSLLQIPWKPQLVGDPFRQIPHGGVLSCLIDVGGGSACLSHMGTYEGRASTVDLRIDYLKPGTTGQDLFCESRIIRLGRRIAFAQMAVYSGGMPDGTEAMSEAIATGQGVYSMHGREAAE